MTSNEIEVRENPLQSTQEITFHHGNIIKNWASNPYLKAATSAAQANTSIHVIMRAGRWKQVNTVMEYIEANQRFTENAATDILSTFTNKTNEPRNDG